MVSDCGVVLAFLVFEAGSCHDVDCIFFLGTKSSIVLPLCSNVLKYSSMSFSSVTQYF